MRDIPIFGNKASVPSRVGALELGEVEGFGDPRLGISFSYHGENVEATTYLYNLGLEKIPSDLRSDEVRAYFDQAHQDVVRTAEAGLYLDLELSEPQFVYLPDDEDPFCLSAEFVFRHGPESGTAFKGPCRSHLAVRTDGGFINKVRYTYPETNSGEHDGSERLLGFMVEWTVFVQAFGSRDETEPVLVSVGPRPQRPS